MSNLKREIEEIQFRNREIEREKEEIRRRYLNMKRKKLFKNIISLCCLSSN